MFKYDKKLQYPIDIKNKDLKMAKYIITQFGGSNGELSASLRYFSLLNDIATEELSHQEMVATMVNQLISGASVKELENAGLSGQYAEHGYGLFPNDVNGVPWNASYIANVGDPIANLMEDMAAEQKARVTYEHLIDLAKDEDVIQPLLFLRQREVVHFNRFKELYEKYTKEGYK